VVGQAIDVGERLRVDGNLGAGLDHLALGAADDRAGEGGGGRRRRCRRAG
jgi:hypothetical protein